MYYFLAHILTVDYAQINEIRKLYDPNYPYTNPHIAVVFPIDVSIGETPLIDHITTITKNWKSFPMTITGLQQSWDYYLYLTVVDGKEQIISLHDHLYTELLAPHWMKAIPFTPHITLGFFADRQTKFDGSDIQNIPFKEKEFKEAMTMAQQFDFYFKTTFDKLTLISRQAKHSPAVVVKEFEMR